VFCALAAEHCIESLQLTQAMIAGMCSLLEGRERVKESFPRSRPISTADAQ
jgi:hypothetical protein